MKKVEIKRNTLGDTRTATRIPTFPEFDRANILHKTDVKNMMGWIAEEICDRARSHDRMKLFEPERSMFYRELCAAIERKMDFERDGQWLKKHYIEERHHLNSHCPDDVNLIDVIEMICDCVCAGMARSGAVRPVEIDADILKRAVDNTVDMLVEAVEVGDSDGHT